MRKLQVALDEAQSEHLAELSTDLYRQFRIGREVAFVDAVYQYVADTRNSKELKIIGSQLLGLIGGDATHIIISNLPFSTPTPPTPERYQPVETADIHIQDVTPLVLYALSGLMARGYAESRGGRVLNDVMPRAGFESKPNSAFGAEKAFDWHADLAYSELSRPHFVGMYCMRNIECAATEFMDPLSVLVDKDLVTALSRPDFNVHFGSLSEDDVRIRNTPILNEEANKWYMHAYMSTDNPDARDALTSAHLLLQNAPPPVIDSLTLGAGDLVIWNNDKLLHRRLPFVPAKDLEERRWLRRAYLYSS